MQALILAGGSGTRFWPSSRRSRPKQLLPMAGDRSLLQVTVDRLRPLVEPESIWVCTTEQLAAAVLEQLPAVPRSQVLAEPMGRNTAPAIAWSVSSMPPELQEGVIAVLPADHYIGHPPAFLDTLERAAGIAERQDRIMTLGVSPTRPETGYGYLELGSTLDDESGLRQVERFTEKPSAAEAERFLDSGDYLWNAGMFVFRGRLLLAEVERYQPEIASGLEAMRRNPADTGKIYSSLPSISIDHGVMEKLTALGTLPLDCGWTDLGSWEALWELLDKDSQGNALQGLNLAIDAKDNLLVSETSTIAAVGVEGLVVVQSGDAVLVIPRDRSQEVRRVIADLRASGREDLL